MKCEICGKEFTTFAYGEGVFRNLCGDSKCFNTKFWQEKVKSVKEDPSKFVVVKGECYYVGDENDRSSFRGHNGARFKIRRDDGTVFITTNLWYNGEIPQEFRKFLPDNAEFVKDKED